jgi:hypothetical protein
MKKVIALSAVLVFGALGMACDGGNAPNANNGNTTKMNTSTPAPVNTATPMTTAPNTNGGGMNANVKPMTNANDNKKP